MTMAARDLALPTSSTSYRVSNSASSKRMMPQKAMNSAAPCVSAEASPSLINPSLPIAVNVVPTPMLARRMMARQPAKLTMGVEGQVIRTSQRGNECRDGPPIQFTQLDPLTVETGKDPPTLVLPLVPLPPLTPLLL